jgi:hypothetical protein
MFDKTTIVKPTAYVDRTINIHRAPTDESVKLLKEFEKAAENRVIEKFVLRSNELQVVAFFTTHEFTGDRAALIKFKLNGKDYKTELNLTTMQCLMNTKEERAKIIFKTLSEWIASELLSRNKEFIQWV